MKPESVKTIAILCWGLMGDIFMRVPIIEAIRDKFPNAKITVVVDRLGYEILHNHPAIDETFIFPRTKKPRWRYLLNKLTKTYYLRRQRFDLMIDLYFGGGCPFVISLANARWRLGFATCKSHAKVNNIVVPFPVFESHWIKGLAQIVEPLGISPSSIRLGSSFYCSDTAKQNVAKFFENHSSGFVAINLGAGDPKKCWDVERFVVLAKKIHQHLGFVPVVFTNHGQEELADAFFERYRGNPMIKLPLLSVDEEAAVMLRCQSIISGDTGLLHLAFALKIPSLSLFTYTRPVHVLPEDCISQVCFIENTNKVDAWQQPLGTKTMPVDYVYQEFCRLQNTIEK